MAQPTDTFDAYDAGNTNREDLADIIYNIAPTDTPALNMMRRGSASNKKHEWLTDDLEQAESNYQVEGDDYQGEERTKAFRLHTYTQISAKSLTVSGTQEVIDKAGRKSEIAYLLSLQAKELKRDIERHIVGFATTADATALGADVDDGSSFPNSIGTSGGGVAARTTANLGTWINSNVDINGSVPPTLNAEGQPNDGDSRTPGTPRAMLESQVKSVIRQAWNAGGDPGYILVDPFNKQVFSSFTGGTTRFDKSEDKTLTTSVDIYISDFGTHRVVPDRFLIQPIPAEGVATYILDMMYWSVDYLRPFQQTPLSKTGDNERRLLLAEWCLTAHNQAASGAIYDLTRT